MPEVTVYRREVLAAASAGLGALTVGSGTAGADPPERHNVGVGSPDAERAVAAAATDVSRVLDWGGGKKTISARFPPEALDGIRRRPGVRYVEADGELHAIAQTLPWGIDRVDAEVAHANAETGSGADVAIIDTGIDDDHPDLGPNVGAGEAFVDCGTRTGGGSACSTSNCNEPWSDDHGHGTHCAGIADAVDDTAGVVGVSTEATLHAVKVLDCNGSGSYSDVAAGIEYVADQGWDVASMSLGGSKSSTVEDAVEYAWGKGVLLVGAAGNGGPCTDCVGFPAAEPEVIAVSATDSNDRLANFSSTGPEVELAAPGRDVYSTVIGGYDTSSGTSMACPHVSGAAGQLMADGNTNETARQHLRDTAEDLGLASNEQGSGLLDVAASLGLDSSDDLGGDSAPTVDALSLDEVETGDADAEFDAVWQVSDADGDLVSVDLTLTDADDGEIEDSASIAVGGDAASGTTRLVASDEDGSGHTYQVDLTVTDADGDAASDAATTTESEDAGGPSAPAVDSLALAEDNHGGNPHAGFEAAWAVSDADGDLDVVDVTLFELDAGGNRAATEDSTTVDVGGAEASGTTDLKAKFDEDSGKTYEVDLVVADTKGDTAADTAREVEDGS